ncbi:MAG: Lysine ketoglutarate reductase (LKR) / Saccharopine dehydrogenase [Cytophagales bacterium]|jgi:alanine dehydrogenase|nr:alanine dehydrogenase [Bacteroidota bacterium]MBS1980037.1 alanine dehydrogenase [Bacteroidota bacterium]WHZ07213.1 MAG: Lysine ketoglutarate reductase (LKR) / Saccharopine dehydrogenase [Cytophagales bacterium]
MTQIKIGLIREGKVPPDKRVAFTPTQTKEIEQRFPQVKIICEPSEIRCFSDSEYRNLGIEVSDVYTCDILMGIKEVPVKDLLANKTYLFFSHTIKKQPYNRRLLQEVLKKNIRLIDYEALKDTQDNRLVAFGRYAGIVGAYNGLWVYGNRYNQYKLRRAHECFDINDLKIELRKVVLPPIKIALTGAGRVAKGAMETLDTVGIRKVSPAEFLNQSFNEPVYTQLSSADYHSRKEGGSFNREEFHQHPDRYHSEFKKFTKTADILLGGAYWNPKAPKLFSAEDMKSIDFKIKIVADITCDIDGSIPCTQRPTSIPDPIYDYNPAKGTTEPSFSHENFITVMAVDNLPCELPRSASEEFGRDLIDKIIRPLLGEDHEKIIERATIAKNGKLTPYFSYLQDYVTQSS